MKEAMRIQQQYSLAITEVSTATQANRMKIVFDTLPLKVTCQRMVIKSRLKKKDVAKSRTKS